MSETLYDLRVISCFFDVLRGKAKDIGMFRVHIRNIVPFVSLVCSFTEIPFHEIEKPIIFVGIYSRIFDDEAAIIMKSFSDLFTVLNGS